MKLDRVNAWLSLAASAAVLVGIVFLAVEINQNTAMMQTQINQSRAAQAMAEAQSLYNSDYVPALLVKVKVGKELSNEERVRYKSLFRAFNRNWDNQLRQFNQGFLAANIPRSLRGAILDEIGGSRLAREEWGETKAVYSDEYVEFVDSVLDAAKPLTAQPPVLSAGDLDAIASLRRAVTEAIVAGDAAAYANLCTEDVRLLHADAPLITGRAELQAHNAAIFDSITVTRLELSPVEVYGVGDLAYEVGTQELSINPSMPGFRSSRKYVHVLQRDADGEWRFAALISNNS